MRSLKLSAIFVVFVSIVVLAGCISDQEYRDLKVRNTRQETQLGELSSKLANAELELDRCRRQVESALNRGSIDAAALQSQVDALEKDIADKKALIASMQSHLQDAVKLPVELSTMLEDFAKKHGAVTFDPASGIVRFKSDLLFEKGSDAVAQAETEAVKALCTILNSEQGGQFDVVVAGHTDDIPIRRQATRAKHATNWHLSVHRAISVRKIMANNGVANERTSVRGFGEYRPVVPNSPGNKGNQQNRRVEIYIVPKGA
jgi:chemotaxis protein MotB